MKMRMLDCHESQMYEWLPYNTGNPDDPDERFEWLKRLRMPDFAHVAEEYREQLIGDYDTGKSVTHAEAFEVCEYGGALTPENRPQLFHFF